MGIVGSLREFDLFTAARQWPAAKAEYLRRGLLEGPPRERTQKHPKVPKSDVERAQREILDAATFFDKGDQEKGISKLDQATDLLQLAAETKDNLRASLADDEERRRTLDQAIDALREGNDGEALRALDSVWNWGTCESILSCLTLIRVRNGLIHRLEEELPALEGNSQRVRGYLAWINAKPEISLERALRKEAEEQSSLPSQRLTFYSKAVQCRIFQAWIKLHDDTNGFRAPADMIRASMSSLGDEPGVSRVMVHIIMPVHAQTMEAYEKHAKRRLDLIERLTVMAA